MTRTVTVDIAGSRMGGAARFAGELHQYLARTGRGDVHLIGAEHRVDPSWLLRREMTGPFRGRRVAVNNVSFVRPGGERWTLLRNALHFLSDDERPRLPASLRAEIGREAAVVRATARRARCARHAVDGYGRACHRCPARSRRPDRGPTAPRLGQTPSPQRPASQPSCARSSSPLTSTWSPG